MSDNPFLPDGRMWAWSSTTLNLAKECPRKYYYAVILGWQPKSLNDNITFGYWYAAALESYHKLRSPLYDYDHEISLRTVVLQTLQSTKDWQSEDTRKNRETLIRSIIWYLEEFKDDPCKTVILKDGRPAVELTFQFKLNEEVTLCGHLDRVVEYAGDVYIQDQKSTGATLGSYYFTRYTPDNQMSLYTVAGQVIWQLPVKGVMIDAAQIAVGFTRFERGFAFRTPEQSEEWLRDAQYHIHRTWEAEKEGWPMNDASCQKYGGCQYLGICSKSPQVREEFLRTGFEKRPINPLEVR
jgi:hypothetical protein